MEGGGEEWFQIGKQTIPNTLAINFHSQKAPIGGLIGLLEQLKGKRFCKVLLDTELVYTAKKLHDKLNGFAVSESDGIAYGNISQRSLLKYE